MATPDLSEIQTQLQNAVNILKEARLYAESNAENFLAHEDALIQSLEGDYAAQIAQGVGSLRASISAILSSSSASGLP